MPVYAGSSSFGAPPPPTDHRRRPRKRLLAAPDWWYLMDRRIAGAVLIVLLVGSGAAAIATFRPTVEPAPKVVAPQLSPAAAAKAEFVAAADRKCRRAIDRIKSLTFPASQAEAVAYVTAAIAINSELLDDLRAMKPPAKQRAGLRKVWRGFDRALIASHSYLDALRSGSPTRMAAAERRVLALTIRANGLARAYGFHDCAEGD